MHAKVLLVSGLAFCAVTQVASSFYKPCACGLKSGGQDVCKHTDLVVRPPKPYKPPYHQGKVMCHKIPGAGRKLKPVGDACTCSKSYVTPALIPPPLCDYCKKRKHHHHHKHHAYPPPPREVFVEDELPRCTYYTESKAPPKIPADSVSYGLAYALAKQHSIKEGILNYGPLGIPKEGAVVKKVKDVPEEGLVTYDKEVVELKLPRGSKSSCSRAHWEREAEAALLLAQQQQELESVRLPSYLTYSDLGYVPEKGKSPEFVVEKGCVTAEERDVVIPYGTETYHMHLPHAHYGGELVVTEYESGPERRYYEHDHYEDSSEYTTEEYEDEGSLDGYVVPVAGHKPCGLFLKKIIESCD